MNGVDELEPNDVAVAAGRVYVRRDDVWAPVQTDEAVAALHVLLGAGFTRPPTPPSSFEDAIRHYLRNEVGKSNYGQMLHTYLDIDRFVRWTRVVAAHRAVEDADVLVSGCQTGGSLVAWWTAGARKVLGVDIDPTLVELAGERITGLPDVEALMYDGRDVPCATATVDVVESIDVLEHVPWPDHYISEVARVLRPGGVCLLITPNRLYPVEQHVRVLGPPWMSIGLANRTYPALASRVRQRNPDLAWRLEALPRIRETNVSFAMLRRLAKGHGLRLELLNPDNHAGYWPVPREPSVVDAMSRHAIGKFVAPTRHISALLWKP